MGDATGGPQQIGGDTPHGDVDSGNPVKVGGVARTFATGGPAAVDDGDRVAISVGPTGVMYVMGGGPDVLTSESTITDADGAQTNTKIIEAGTQTIIVTHVSVLVSNEVTDTSFKARIGFDVGGGGLPAESTSGVEGIVFSHPGIAPGSGGVEGVGSGILGAGASGEDLLISCDDPVNGEIKVLVTYLLVD